MQRQFLILLSAFTCFSGICHATRLTRTNFERLMASRNLQAASLPDPRCKSGILSLAGVGPDPQVCCPKYCGECSDYPTCATKQGGSAGQLAEAAKGTPASFLQFDPEGASAAACCASKVAEMECGKGAPANVCLKKCSDSLPPCIMEAGEKFEMPKTSSAAADCNEAIPEWMEKAELAVTGADDTGADQWKDYEKRMVAGATKHDSWKENPEVSLGLAQKKKKTAAEVLAAHGFTKEQVAQYLHYKATGKMC